MPVISDGQHSVHVAIGESNGVVGAQCPGLPMTILDGRLTRNGSFKHELAQGRNAWIHAIDGAIDVAVSVNATRLQKGQAIATGNSERDEPLVVHVSNSNDAQAHFVILDGEAIDESFIQQGPFVMSSTEEIEAINQAFVDGRFGSID